MALDDHIYIKGHILLLVHAYQMKPFQYKKILITFNQTTSPLPICDAEDGNEETGDEGAIGAFCPFSEVLGVPACELPEITLASTSADAG